MAPDERARFVEVSLATLDRQIEEEDILSAEPLQPGDEPFPIIVGRGPRYLILDGYHRAAGFLLWADDEGVALSTTVDAIQVLDDDLAADISEPGPRQAPAIAIAIEAANEAAGGA